MTGPPILGSYGGFLDNSGETVKLGDGTDNTILEFRYEDRWYPGTDGEGYSLEITAPQTTTGDTWDLMEVVAPNRVCFRNAENSVFMNLMWAGA